LSGGRNTRRSGSVRSAMTEGTDIHGDEWRVEVELGEEHGVALVQRLSAAQLDEEASAKLGNGVIITHDGPHLFAYAASEPGARQAESVIRGLIAEEGLEASVRLTRWHPIEEAWKDAATPLPQTEDEQAAERARHGASERAEEEETGEADWEVSVHLESLSDMRELDRRLRDEGLHVERRWKYLLVGAPTEERAEELADKVRALAPESATVEVIVNPDDLPNPAFVAIGALAARIRDRL
jgi:hypothetical protein